jgi:hypothetical protein
MINMSTGRRFSDLSEKEKAMVIGGMAFAVIFMVASMIYFTTPIIQDSFGITSLLKSGSSMFSVMNLYIPSLYLVIILPAVIAYASVTSYFIMKERSLVHTLKFILLTIALGGLVCLSLTGLLSIMGLFFSHSSSYVQIVVICLTSSISLLIFGRITLSKRVQSYLKKFE